MLILILLSMLFLHIVDDYYLQGILAKLKQKSWWEENAPNPLYKNDYIVALVEHAFSWTFMIMLPIAITMVVKREYYMPWFIGCFIVNWIIHGLIDHLKANVHNCNLITDQCIHTAQVISTWTVMTAVMEIV